MKKVTNSAKQSIVRVNPVVMKLLNQIRPGRLSCLRRCIFNEISRNIRAVGVMLISNRERRQSGIRILQISVIIVSQS